MVRCTRTPGTDDDLQVTLTLILYLENVARNTYLPESSLFQPRTGHTLSPETRTLSVEQQASDTIVDLQQLGAGLTQDLVRGDLNELRSSRGNFTTALDAIIPGTDACMANDTMTASVLDTRFDPPAGYGWFYLARCLASTYNSGSSSQQGDRDPQIAASANACP